MEGAALAPRSFSRSPPCPHRGSLEEGACWPRAAHSLSCGLQYSRDVSHTTGLPSPALAHNMSVPSCHSEGSCTCVSEESL